MNLPINRDIYTIARLNREIRTLLEQQFPLLWVEGEVSNLSRPASGHLYFTLKDRDAQVRCALFRNRASSARQSLSNGQHLIARVKVALYEPRGDYQLIVEQLEEAGEGALRQAFEALRQRLEQQGLFDIDRKQPLPKLPRRIGLVTSPSGAAIRDVLTVLKRRFPALPVRVYPVPVQGSGSAEQIAAALKLAGERQDCDVLLLVRGGGSLEDLWAFNEEVLARAIVDCPIPVVSGVGHETDLTIADLVADLRAPTPSAAAELVSPDAVQWQQRLDRVATALETTLQRRLADQRRTLTVLTQRLHSQHPGRRLQDKAQRLDDLEQRLRNAMIVRLERWQTRTDTLAQRLQSRQPGPLIRQLGQRLQALDRQLDTAISRQLQQRRDRLGTLARTLQTVSPLNTLERGYAIARRHDDGTVIRQSGQVKPGEQVEIRLHQGQLVCTVEDTLK